MYSESLKSLQPWTGEGRHAAQVKVPQREGGLLPDHAEVCSSVSHASDSPQPEAGELGLSHLAPSVSLVSNCPRGHTFPGTSCSPILGAKLASGTQGQFSCKDLQQLAVGRESWEAHEGGKWVRGFGGKQTLSTTVSRRS